MEATLETISNFSNIGNIHILVVLVIVSRELEIHFLGKEEF